MKSIKSRMSYATIVLLVVCAGILGTMLTNAFRKTLVESERKRLEGIVYTVLSLVDVTDKSEVWFDDEILDSSAQGADVYIVDANHKVLWPANLNEKMGVVDVGQWNFQAVKEAVYAFSLSFGFSWSFENAGEEFRYTMHIKDKGQSFQEQMGKFQKKLWLWLGTGCLVLILLQILMINWGFHPIKLVTKEIQDIEQGQKHKFENVYPTEVDPLTKNINSLLRHERGQQMRFRQSLDNLAHALKTPLAALGAMVDDPQNVDNFANQSKEQLQRMQSMIDYQLQKASTIGKSPFTKPVHIKTVIDSIVSSLQKVYAQKNMDFNVQVSKDAFVKMDEGDLFEVLGNVIENAAKYGDSKVQISFSDNICSIEDDGPGIKQENIDMIVQRGVRLDQRIEGSGIGLSVAYEIMSIYSGSLEFLHSDLGGAKVQIRFS